MAWGTYKLRRFPISLGSLCLFIIFSGIAVSVLCTFTSETDDRFFPYSQGWLGGDSAYSVPLDSTSTLWLFGDTFVGKQGATDRRQSSAMIHNSVAIRKCHGGCSIQYWWSGMYTPHPKSFFRTANSDYYWPLDGFVYRSKLYIFWEHMHKVGNGGAFGFDYSGVVLATVANYNASPADWKISSQTITTGNAVVPGIAATLLPLPAATIASKEVLSPDYTYVFTLFRRSAKTPFIGLLRLPLAALSSAGSSTRWEYLDTTSKWHSWRLDSSPPGALKLIDGNITEMSVVYHPDLYRWVAIYPTPGFLSTTASYSTAGRFDRPWTEAHPLFAYPEMQRSDPSYTPNVFCYAAKEHPELESGGNFALTYACNSTQEPEIMRDMRLYRPELIVKPAL